MAARQGIRLRLRNKNKKARFVVKYTYSQRISTKNGRQTSKYTYSKIIAPIRRKKYSYKRV